MAAGLALIEAVETVVPNRALSLKWPNDLMLGDAKLAGILLERSGDRIVAGIGINLAGAPNIPGRKTAALKSIKEVAPQEFAPVLAATFARLLSAWRSAEPAQFAQAWLAKAHPIGAALEVHSAPEERVRGTFDGIELDGALRLRRSDGTIDVVRAADVFLG